jgi:hypothetical protein
MFKYFGNDDEVLQLALCKSYILAEKLDREAITNFVGGNYLKYMWLEVTKNGNPQRIASPAAAHIIYENTTESDFFLERHLHASPWSFTPPSLCYYRNNLGMVEVCNFTSAISLRYFAGLQKHIAINKWVRDPKGQTCTLQDCIIHKESKL